MGIGLGLWLIKRNPMPYQFSQRKAVMHNVFGVNKALHYLHYILGYTLDSAETT